MRSGLAQGLTVREAIEEILRRQRTVSPEASPGRRALSSSLMAEPSANQWQNAGRQLPATRSLDPMIERFGLGGVDLSTFPTRHPTPYLLRAGSPSGPEGLQRTYAAAAPRLVKTATSARPISAPSLLPPMFIPGTPENNAFSREFARALQGMAGSIGPTRGIQSRPNDEDECEELYQRDITNCKVVRAVKGGGAASRCYESANRRNFECRQHGPSGVRTPLHGW